MVSIAPVEMTFAILTGIFVVLTAVWFLLLIIKHETKKAWKVLLSAFISACLGFLMLIATIVVSAVSQFWDVPMEYGLGIGLILTPIIALIVHLIFARHLLNKPS